MKIFCTEVTMRRTLCALLLVPLVAQA